jgi:predicted DNA-binding antitoxin AbrB/MazE fold protein
MTTAVKAIYEHGVFRPLAPVRLKEATEVEVLLPEGATEDDDDPTGWKAAEELIGFIKGGLKEPVGEEHDKHLYQR